MATPSGVTPGTPLGCMFAWEDERLARTSKWRGETGSEKLLVARFARAVLALREVRDVTRIMELSATTGVFPPAPVTKSHVVVVEPVLASKRGRKGSSSAGLEPPAAQAPPLTDGSSPMPIVPSKVAKQPCRPRNPTRAPDNFGSWITSRFQSFPSVAEKVASVTEATRVWIWSANLFFNIFVFVATWLPVVLMGILPCLLAAEPMLIVDMLWMLASMPSSVFGSRISQMATALRPSPTPAPAPPICVYNPMPHINATYGAVNSSYYLPMPPTLTVPPSFADPPFAAGGGALLGVAIGVGGVLRGPAAIGALRAFR